MGGLLDGTTLGGDHTLKYLESHKLAGFRVYIMGYQVNLYLGRGGWACLFGMTIAEMTACNLA